jgi:basic membrane protein A
VEKRVGESLFLALKATIEGTQEYGKSVLLGLPEGAVGISKNAYYEKLVPAEIRAEIEALEAKIASGEIVPNTDMK